MFSTACRKASWDDILYELHVRQKIEAGLKDVEDGHTVPPAALVIHNNSYCYFKYVSADLFKTD
jgi:hypothetical protein